MFTTGLCAPALVYIGFSLIQIFIDIYNGVINNAFLKFIIMLVFTLIINILCDLGYSVIAWFLVFIPIIMMTIISTLLLRVFGLDPNDTDLRSQINNNNDISYNEFNLTDSELLNQQSYAYAYDRYKNDNRIDRDKLRKNFYDNVEDKFDLSNNEENNYDLSNNPTKYFLVSRIVNNLSEMSFIKNIVNSRLYNNIFSNGLKDNSMLYNNYLQNVNNNNLPYNSNLPNINFSLGKNNSNNNSNVNNFYSYSNKYDDEYKIDGFLLFKRHKYNDVKQELMITDPDVNDIEIDKNIENMWNNLTESERDTWNNSNQANSNKNNKTNSLEYDPNNLNTYDQARTSAYISSLTKYENNQTCPSNETPITFKAKTGLECYEVCPPGKIRNSDGDCE